MTELEKLELMEEIFYRMYNAWDVDDNPEENLGNILHNIKIDIDKIKRKSYEDAWSETEDDYQVDGLVGTFAEV